MLLHEKNQLSSLNWFCFLISVLSFSFYHGVWKWSTDTTSRSFAICSET